MPPDEEVHRNDSGSQATRSRIRIRSTHATSKKERDVSRERDQEAESAVSKRDASRRTRSQKHPGEVQSDRRRSSTPATGTKAPKRTKQTSLTSISKNRWKRIEHTLRAKPDTSSIMLSGATVQNLTVIHAHAIREFIIYSETS